MLPVVAKSRNEIFDNVFLAVSGGDGCDDGGGGRRRRRCRRRRDGDGVVAGAFGLSLLFCFALHRVRSN